MEALGSVEIREILGLYLGDSGGLVDGAVFDKLHTYLNLLLKWNARTNLTAIREPREIVGRHFGESLFVAGKLGAFGSLLDFGSGAGFPGIPIQLLHPGSMVTLAESQGKKAAFLREAVRELGLRSEIWGGRVEAMPEGQRFEIVALRAVDDMSAALKEAGRRASDRVLVMGTVLDSQGLAEILSGFGMGSMVEIPGRERQVLLEMRRKL
jgi:16S rRNA (guanine527-N7)-methyltransferase